MRGIKTPPGRRLSQLALARGALTGRVAILAAAARRDASPHRTATTSAASPAIGRAIMAGGFLSHCEGNYEPVQGDL